MSDDEIYEEPNCLMCDDTGVIDNPDTGDQYPCYYYDTYDKLQKEYHENIQTNATNLTLNS